MIISKCVCFFFLLFFISLPIYVHSDWFVNAHKHKRRVYHINQSQLNITSHIQSYCDRGIASYHVTFPHSFSLTHQANSRHAVEGLLKLNGLWGGKRDTNSHCNFTCWCHCWYDVSLEKRVTYKLFNVTIYLYLYFFFLIQYFEEPLPTLPPWRICPWYIHTYIQYIHTVEGNGYRQLFGYWHSSDICYACYAEDYFYILQTIIVLYKPLILKKQSWYSKNQWARFFFLQRWYTKYHSY